MVRFAGSRGLPAAATAWHDSVFNQPLSFYLFDLPFYSLLRGYLLALVIVCILVYWVAARGWQLRYRMPDLRDARELDPESSHARGRPGIALPARRRRGPAARLRAEVLSGPLRNGVQRTRQLPGGHRLCRSEHRPAAAMAGDLRLPRRRGVRLDGPLVPGRPDGARSGGGFRRSPPGERALCAAQRDLARSARTSRLISTPRAPPSASSSEFKEVEFKAHPDAPIDVAAHKPIARQRPPLGHARLPRYGHADPGAAPLLRVRRHRRGPLHDRRPVPPDAADAARTRSSATAGGARQLDQPGLHLYARLRRGARARQPDHAGRPAGAADRKRAARGEDQAPQADAAGNLLRRSDARAGVRAHVARRVQLPQRGNQRLLALRRQGRISGLRLRHAAGRRHQ